MKKAEIFSIALFVCISSIVWGDTFGTGDNRFEIDFVTISGSTNPTSGISAGDSFIFTGVTNDYRIGKFEITNDQWNAFTAAAGAPTGNDVGYTHSSYWTGDQQPTNRISWYEAAQFCNYLTSGDKSKGAYQFSGNNANPGSFLGIDRDTATAVYSTIYVIPTENEWVKAAYWNGLALQTYATKTGESLYQGNGSNGGWNYHDGDTGPDGPAEGPWIVGSGSEELNGTYDMMGNVWEWNETFRYLSSRGNRGGSYNYPDSDGAGPGLTLASSARLDSYYPYAELTDYGFRVASIPEPASLLLLALGGMALRYRRS